MSYFDSVTVNTDNSSGSPFGRLRVASPETLFGSKLIYDNQPLFWDDQQVSGSGTSSIHSIDMARSRLSVSALTAGKRVRQTFQSFNYQPGKSQLILMTGVLAASGGGVGIKRAFGYGNGENGIFLVDDEGVYKVRRRTHTSGFVVDNDVSQDNWNLDNMDGAGPSGITADFAKAHALIIDLEWLGTGRVRIGLVIDGQIFYVHEFLNANVLTEVYMSTANLPVRYEIENTGAGVASSLDHICATVISEGGSQESGIVRYYSIGANHINANTVGTKYIVAGIRLKPGALSGVSKQLAISVLNKTSDNYEWQLLFNPVLANSITWADQANSFVQTGSGDTVGNPSTTTATGGTIMGGGLVKSSTNAGDVTVELQTSLRLGSKIDGTRDEMYLAVIPYGANADIYGGITWREL